MWEISAVSTFGASTSGADTPGTSSTRGGFIDFLGDVEATRRKARSTPQQQPRRRATTTNTFNTFASREDHSHIPGTFAGELTDQCCVDDDGDLATLISASVALTTSNHVGPMHGEAVNTDLGPDDDSDDCDDYYVPTPAARPSKPKKSNKVKNSDFFNQIIVKNNVK